MEKIAHSKIAYPIKPMKMDQFATKFESRNHWKVNI
jgi:hypothetical protein